MHKKQPMKLTIPNIESLPPDHHLNRQIDGLNRDQRMDQVYRASVAAAIARFLAERLRADSDLDWIREVNRLIDGIRLHTPTVENVYADLGETERMMAPAKLGSGSLPVAFSIVLAIIASLMALLELSRLYRECKLGWLGTEIQAGDCRYSGAKLPGRRKIHIRGHRRICRSGDDQQPRLCPETV
jgi:hypothetical protein